MERPRPQVVPLASVPVIPADEAPTKVRIARLITRQRYGSNLLLGASWFDPGEETNLWSSSPRSGRARATTGTGRSTRRTSSSAAASS